MLTWQHCILKRRLKPAPNPKIAEIVQQVFKQMHTPLKQRLQKCSDQPPSGQQIQGKIDLLENMQASLRVMLVR